MKPRSIIGGVILFIVAIIGSKITPNIMSQIEKIVMPLQGNVPCGLSKDIQINTSQITSLSPVNQFFHENICSTLNLAQITLELSMIGIGIIAILLVIYGGLTNPEKVKDKLTIGKDSSSIFKKMFD